MKTKPLLIGFISGFTVAGISVLLSTPSSGKELRGKLQDSKEEAMTMLQNMKESITQLKVEAASATAIGKSQITYFMNEMKDLISDWQKDASMHTNNIQMQINDVETAIQELEAAISPINSKSEKPAE